MAQIGSKTAMVHAAGGVKFTILGVSVLEEMDFYNKVHYNYGTNQK